MTSLGSLEPTAIQFTLDIYESSLITHDIRFVFFFIKNTELCEHTITFHCQNHPVLSGLLWLVVFQA